MKEISFSFQSSPPATTGPRRSLSLSFSLFLPASHSPVIINITKCILIAFFFRFRVLFFVLVFVLLSKTPVRRRVICFGASSSPIRQSLLVGSLSPLELGHTSKSTKMCNK